MIKDLFLQGVTALIDEAAESEKAKVGRLRAGNTGMLRPDGTFIGSCPGYTYLRMQGIQVTKTTPHKELMFAGGRLNEDHWYEVLAKSYTNGIILREEEIATYWETSNGISVTGRPDIVLCDNEKTPQCGIELKQVMSVNSAYNTLVKREPQLKHLMQAAHYMWQLDCPFELWYTNRNMLDVPGWMEFRPFPKPHEDFECIFSYRYYRSGDINPKTGKPKKHQITEQEYMDRVYPKSWAQVGKIGPFLQGFKLELDTDNYLWYKDERDPAAKWIKSIVKVDYILNYYEEIASLTPKSKVPKPALNLGPTGDKLNWPFHQYSDLGDLDIAHCQGMTLEQWVNKIK